MVQVTVRTPLHDTEDPERVEQSASAFFPDLQCVTESGSVVGTGSDVLAFRAQVWDQEIIDTVRASLLNSMEGPAIRFRLSKQAALQGVISIPADRNALGDLDVKLVVEPTDKWTDGEALAWWLCPETEEGKIVGPTD